MVGVCAWCGAYLGEREPLNDYSVTHGICGACRDKLMAEANVMAVGDSYVKLADDDALEAAAREEIESLGFSVEEVIA